MDGRTRVTPFVRTMSNSYKSLTHINSFLNLRSTIILTSNWRSRKSRIIQISSLETNWWSMLVASSQVSGEIVAPSSAWPGMRTHEYLTMSILRSHWTENTWGPILATLWYVTMWTTDSTCCRIWHWEKEHSSKWNNRIWSKQKSYPSAAHISEWVPWEQTCM